MDVKEFYPKISAIIKEKQELCKDIDKGLRNILREYEDMRIDFPEMHNCMTFRGCPSQHFDYLHINRYKNVEIWTKEDHCFSLEDMTLVQLVDLLMAVDEVEQSFNQLMEPTE